MRTANLSQKYFVNKNSQLAIQCLACKKSRTLPIEILKEKQHTIKVKCPCNNTFMVDIEFRKHYRKKVNFIGGYRLSNAPVGDTKDCTVTDLSLGGLSIKIINDETIKEFDELIVIFSQDDQSNNEIERKIKVLHVGQEKKVGGEFMESENNGKDNEFSFYLL